MYSDFMDGKMIKSVEGSDLNLNIYRWVRFRARDVLQEKNQFNVPALGKYKFHKIFTVNGVRLRRVALDMEADNGYIHVLRDVLPPIPNNETIVQVLENDPEQRFTYLLEVTVFAQLVEMGKAEYSFLALGPENHWTGGGPLWWRALYTIRAQKHGFWENGSHGQGQTLHGQGGFDKCLTR